MPIIITCKRQNGSQLFSLICLLRNRHVGPELSTFSPLGPLHYPWVLSVVFKCFANIRISDQIAFLCVHAPRGHIQYTCVFCVFCPPPSLSDKNPVILTFFASFVPFRLSSLSMAKAPVASLPYFLEAVRPATIPPSITSFYSVGRFRTGFQGGYHSPFHFHSECRFKLFHSLRRFQLLWRVSPSRWFFSACVTFRLAISGVSRFH